MKKSMLLCIGLIMFLSGCGKTDNPKSNHEEGLSNTTQKKDKVANQSESETASMTRNSNDGESTDKTESSSEESKLTSEEIATAVYIESYRDTYGGGNRSIKLTVDSFLQVPFFEIDFLNNEYSIGCGTGPSTQKITFDGSTIISRQLPSATEYKDTGYQQSAIEKEYHDEKESLDALKTLSESNKKAYAASSAANKANSTVSTGSSVDTKNLTSDQAITWVKNYLLSQGATQAEVDDTGFKTQFDDNHYLQVLVYQWPPVHVSRILTYIYRINASGELEEEEGTSSGNFNVVSSEYIE